MTEAELKALELMNAVRAEFGYSPPMASLNRDDFRIEALCRAIEAHEAFAQEVSDALGERGLEITEKKP